MRTPNRGDLLFWLLAVVAAAFLALFALVLGGAVPIAPADSVPEAAAPVAAPVGQEPAVEEPVVEPPRSERSSSTANAAKQPARQLVTVVVTATRGDCWLAARAGTESGRVLEERILRQGESVRLRAPRVWLSLGASSNVDVVVDEQSREVPAGTVELVLAPRSTT